MLERSLYWRTSCKLIYGNRYCEYLCQVKSLCDLPRLYQRQFSSSNNGVLFFCILCYFDILRALLILDRGLTNLQGLTPKGSILSSLLNSFSCCNRIPQTKWLINSRNLLLTALEADKSEFKAPAWSHPGEGPLRGS